MLLAVVMGVLFLTEIKHDGIKMQNNLSHNITTNKPLWLIHFVSTYQRLSIDNLDLLATIYHQDVTFIDPMHQVEGFDELYKYFDSLYQNLSSCVFDINNVIAEGDEAAIYWKMSYQHPKLNQGEVVTVLGSSHVKGRDDKVFYHRDYLDLGAMLYEQLPLFGKLTKWIKAKAAS
jgi:hypothetical protein